MKNEFKIKPKSRQVIYYAVICIFISFVLQDEISINDFNLSIVFTAFFWLMFIFSLLGLIFPKKITLKDKYLEYKFLANKIIIPYNEIKVFMRKNFLVKVYLITDKDRKRKITLTGLPDETINDFEESLEVKLIQNNIT